MADTCPICGGEGWVCENHPAQPWSLDTGCSLCDGAGEPCPVCNPLMVLPRPPRDFEAND